MEDSRPSITPVLVGAHSCGRLPHLFVLLSEASTVRLSKSAAAPGPVLAVTVYFLVLHTEFHRIRSLDIRMQLFGDSPSFPWRAHFGVIIFTSLFSLRVLRYDGFAVPVLAGFTLKWLRHLSLSDHRSEPAACRSLRVFLDSLSALSLFAFLRLSFTANPSLTSCSDVSRVG